VERKTNSTYPFQDMHSAPRCYPGLFQAPFNLLHLWIRMHFILWKQILKLRLKYEEFNCKDGTMQVLPVSYYCK